MSNALAIVPPEPLDTSALSADAALLIRDAEAVTIIDDDSYIAACNFGKGVMALKKRITDFFAPRKQRWHEGHAFECKCERDELANPERAEKIIKGKVLAWQAAERQRQDNERRDLEAKARKLEEEVQLQRAIDAEAEGDWPETVDEILSEPIEAPVVVMSRPAAKIAGVAAVKRWTIDADHVDLAAVIRHVAGLAPDAKLARPELINLLALNTSAARQMATAQREHFKVPGIRAYQAAGVSFGSK